MINGHTEGSFLDDKKYWIIFECAAALEVPIYLRLCEFHPAAFRTYFAGNEELSCAAWGFPMDTCSHSLRLVFARLFHACLGLKIILGHLGEGGCLPAAPPRRPYAPSRLARPQEDAGAISDRELGHRL